MVERIFPKQPKVVEKTGLAVVHEGEKIYADEESAAIIATAGPNVVNYYFPVEIEVIAPGAPEEFAEMIYDALQREFNAIG